MLQGLAQKMRGLLGLSGLGLIVSVVSACGPIAEFTPSPAPGTFQPPPVTLQSIRFEGYRGTGREFEVRAERANVRALDRIAMLEEVEIVFLDTGRGSLEVTADRAELDLAKDDFVLQQNVRGQTGSGVQFVTSEVRYDPEARLLRTQEDVSVERGNWTLKGKGMEIDVPGRRLRVLEPQRPHRPQPPL